MHANENNFFFKVHLIFNFLRSDHNCDCQLVWELFACNVFIQLGFVNGLAFSSEGACLVAAVGQEHRFGRWWKESAAKNRLAIIPLDRNIQ